MKNNSIQCLAVFSLMLALVASSAHAKDFKVDQAHSSVGFQVRHLVSKVDGNFRDFAGKFSYDGEHAAAFHLEASAKVDSIDTNNKKRDDHLKSPDFFDSKKFPAIEFKSTKIEKADNTHFKVTGDFTMHGVTKPVVFEVEHLGEAKDPMGTVRTGVSAATTVNRKDFGIVWNKTLDSGGLMLGEDVKITLNLELVEDMPTKKDSKKSK